ncbi:MAG TPA: WD40 repeat domain-containing protein [Solirubrobacteraceae bacterium]|jgi:WD40 repeat protein|nr:WD40 repeat domain-containing protein [Solirubrobacteraceae bacterium]
MIEHRGPISGVAADGALVATAGYDNQVILWDADRKQAISRAFHDHLANQCSFTPCGRFLLTSSSDHTARLWKVPSLQLVAVLADHDDDVESCAAHPELELVATASRDHGVRVYDFDGVLVRHLEGHTADVISVAWIGEDLLVSSSDDGTIRRWATGTGECLDTLSMHGVETDTIAVAEDGTIFAGDDSGTITVIDGDTASRIQAHDAGIKRIVYSASARMLVSLSYDRTASIWRRNGTLELVVSADLPPVIWPRSCAFLGDDKLVFATFGSSYATYDIPTGTWDVEGVHDTISLNAVAPYDGGRLTVGDAGVVRRDGAPLRKLPSLCNFLTAAGPVVITGGQTGQVFDALSGRMLHQHRSPLNCGAAFERDGVRHVMVGTYTGEGLVFRVDDDGEVEHVDTVELHANAVKGVAVADGVIFSVCADTAVAFHATEDLRLLQRQDAAHDRIANGCVALGDAGFASVGRDHKLRLWRDLRGEPVDTPHTHSIKCVAASSDGDVVATGSYNGRIALYDRRGRRWTRVIRPTAAGISSIAYDATNGVFLASSYDGAVHEVAR